MQHHRVNVTLPSTPIDHHRRRELIAFARYCAERIDRELGGIEAWDIALENQSGASAAIVRVRVRAGLIEARGSAVDPAFAIWNAMCQIEQPLRDAAVASASG